MKRTIAIATKGVSLSIRNAQLVVQLEGETLSQVPVEDIGLVTLEGSGIRITSGALNALASSGAAVLACDAKHLPSSLALPVVGNGLHAERIRYQFAASQPLRKQLWKRIVVAKILNQRQLLKGKPGHRRLHTLAQQVCSGDVSNVEAQAARSYWAELFTTHDPTLQFRRDRHGAFPNAVLNYGYAVLRAASARALVGAGLHPGHGIHHHNRYSGFPLADDLMEPFRPWVDAVACKIIARGCTRLGRDERAFALEVLTHDVGTAQGTRPLWASLDHTAATLAEALRASVAEQLRAVDAAGLLALPQWPTHGA
ncbi:MAG: subtype II CRISPR-associated endonuclease Cas1 [Planctomycetes bacterium]|nr:subtype II CRISPR-associated endonuclease Cas1 [Planctomycetota bacterium]